MNRVTRSSAARLLVTLFSVTVLLGWSTANAQKPSAPTFPTKPVTIISTFSAGSGPDTMMRAAAEKLSLMWKQPVLIDNRPGGAGFIAINAARTAPSDSHTFLMHDGDAIGALPSLFKSRNFQVFESFEAVGVLYSTPLFIVVSSNAKWKSVGELLAIAKAKPGTVTYGTWGVGTVAHLQSALLANKSQVEMLHVPYKEMGQLYTGVSTSETDWALGALASTQFAYQGGRVKYLAVMRAQRIPAMPNVPTLAESGGPVGIEATGFVALLAPKGSAKGVIDQFNHDLIEAISSPEIQARFKTFGFEAMPTSPAETQKVVEQRSALYEQVASKNNIKLD